VTGFWYTILQKCGGLFGGWLFVLVSRLIAAGYFCVPGRRRESLRLFAALYPEKNRLFHLFCVFRQFQNFTTIHYDRFLTARGIQPHCTSEGREQLEEVIGGRGAVLLMSHLGNWEMAAHLLKKQNNTARMLLYMGVKEKEGVERLQKEELQRAGITIIGVDRSGGSPFSAVEGIQALRAGGLVSMSGDIIRQQDQQTVTVPFLGHEVQIPRAPYVFALVSGAPLFAFFAFRTGRNSYHLTLEGPIIIPPHARNNRQQAIAAAACQYAGLLEQAVRQHPCQWYHFERFLTATKNSRTNQDTI